MNSGDSERDIIVHITLLMNTYNSAPVLMTTGTKEQKINHETIYVYAHESRSRDLHATIHTLRKRCCPAETFCEKQTRKINM